jgi:integrase
MGRRSRDTNLSTREARSRLKPDDRKLYKKQLLPGVLYLGYRPSERRGDHDGTWYGGVYLGDRKYHWEALGAADDHHPADDRHVLDYRQADKAARKLLNHPAALSETTVANAAAAYLEWFRHERKSIAATETAIRAHILPSLGHRRVADVTKAQYSAWLDKIARSPARLRVAKGKRQKYREAPQTDDEKRARRATANRIMNVLKALLNFAVDRELVLASAPRPWREVKPFKNTDEPKIRFLGVDECKRLINACPADLRSLVQAALFTGARFGELARLHVTDVDTDHARVHFAPGKARHVPLSGDGAKFFAECVAGHLGPDFVFTKHNGTPWGKNHHVRALTDACKRAKIAPVVTYHELRHTYASMLINAGEELPVIAKLLGHADTRVTLRHYAHLADKTLAAAVTKLPDFRKQPEGKVRAIR